MKLARNVLVAFALAASVVACDDEDDPTGSSDPITVADLAGEYTISSFTYTPDAGGDPLNLTALGMGVTELTVASNGSFTGVLRFPDGMGGAADFDIGGTIQLASATTTGASLTINFNEATQALGILDASETGSLTLDRDDGTMTMTLTEVTVPMGLPGGGADADLVMVASLN